MVLRALCEASIIREIGWSRRADSLLRGKVRGDGDRREPTADLLITGSDSACC